MVYIIKSFLTILSFSAAALATVVKIEADITTLSTAVTSLDKSINAYPNTGGTVAGALVIHTEAQGLINDLGTATTDIQATSGLLSLSDGKTILSSVQAIQPVILDALTVLVKKKAALQALPLGGVPAIVLADLKSLNTTAVKFADSLLKICPSALLPQATSIRDSVAVGFSGAIAGYS
ncbi:hydrophobic surface binding protein [Pholiota conissans]|uniref:Hydrophobic surface binding protein n=1 Tax=Pholiota conissans TaxID=109636 RepID=A0A9P5YS99_9AGAR|nr:hydrophobic surface binding protein [Pholiota conissans]